MADLDALTAKYAELLKNRYSKTPVDWTPVEYIGNSSTEYRTSDLGTEITFFKKSLFKKSPKLRFLLILLKTKEIAGCMQITEKLKPSLNLDVYTVVIFIGDQTPKDVVNFVECFNSNEASAFLIEPETEIVKSDYKSITRNYLKWLDFKKEPIPTKDRLSQISEKSGEKNILDVKKVREEYNFTHGQALDFLHTCKFLKRKGLTDIFVWK